jgi:ubiquinone/menaquinone biosynthesis C-methylase UbiE
MNSSLDKIVLEFGFMPGDHVADFGSGSGHLSLAMAKTLGSTGRLYAIDLHKEGLNRLQNMAEEEGLRNVYVVYGDVEKERGTELKDEVVHGVIFSNIIFQLEDRVAGILEAKRILAPNGRLILLEETKKIGDIEIRKHFEKNGLSLERRMESDQNRTILIFRKR